MRNPRRIRSTIVVVVLMMGFLFGNMLVGRARAGATSNLADVDATISHLMTIKHPVQRVQAQDEPGGANEPVSLERFCVVGDVIDQDEKPLAGWVVEAHPLEEPDRLVTAVSDEEGSFRFEEGLYHEPWRFALQLQPGWSAITADDFEIALSYGQTECYQIRFRMRQSESIPSACINVSVIDGNLENQGLPNVLVQVSDLNGSLVKEARTDGQGKITFDGLDSGTYVVREEIPTGWEPTSPTIIRVSLTSEDVCGLVSLRFYHKQISASYCIEGHVLDANCMVGIAGWQIAVDPLVGSRFIPGLVDTNGLGEFRIDFPMDDQQIPGSIYDVCQDVVVGWEHSRVCQRVQLPKKAGPCVSISSDFVNDWRGY